MIDLLGHIAYASIFVGVLLIARGHWIGWLFKVAGDAGWVALGIALGLSSIVTWDSLFIAIDVYGLYHWRTR